MTGLQLEMNRTKAEDPWRLGTMTDDERLKLNARAERLGIGQHYYDKHGVPIPMGDWCALFGDLDYRRVASDEIGESRISTIWLGIDHNFGFDGEPILFETMVFGGALDGEQWRYRTLDEALAGHNEIVEMVRKALALDG